MVACANDSTFGSVMMYIIVKSAFKTLQQGGIYWRDSFYPLEELKKQR
jgi:hypothetical protein